MLKSIWSLRIVWCVWAILFYGIPGYAQIAEPTKKVEKKTKLAPNPFDFVQGITENAGQVSQGRGLANAAQHNAKPENSTSLKYRTTQGSSPGQAQVIYNSLVQQYGPPKSVRGKSHVWDIENPAKSAVQADVVTVILKMEENGTYELVMDRDRGGDGRATWDATRIQKANAKKASAQQKKQKKSKPQLILQADND